MLDTQKALMLVITGGGKMTPLSPYQNLYVNMIFVCLYYNMRNFCNLIGLCENYKTFCG